MTREKSLDVVKQAKDVLKIEAEGILNLAERIGPEISEAVDMIYKSSGRVVVAGLGKSGLVGRKLVATFNSTGTPAIFLHPVEAMHGDLGMVMPNDVVLALSNSGETHELCAIMDSIRSLGAGIIAMTGDPASTLAGQADVVLDAAVPREACPLGLAPTASTTAALALGDALAVTLIERRSFGSSDFQRLHPGGSLGERLSVQVSEVMITGRSVPSVRPDADLTEALQVMNRRSLGALMVTDKNRRLTGIFTDGDFRRLLAEHGRMPDGVIADHMTGAPVAISPERLAAEALEIMQAREITVLPIVDGRRRLKGMIHLHDLLGKGKFRFNQVKNGA